MQHFEFWQGRERASPILEAASCSILVQAARKLKPISIYPTVKGQLSVRLEFTLFKTPIEVEGTIAWKKQSTDGYQYGIDFVEDPSLSKLIVDELKLRRRTEVGLSDGKQS